jgi:hypothetical protein
MAAPGMFSSGFLSEKSVAGLPNWTLGIGAVAGLVLLKTWQNNKSKSVAATGPATTPGTASNYVTPGTMANNTGAPTVFVVPGATPSAPSQPPLIGRTNDAQTPSQPSGLHLNRTVGTVTAVWVADAQSDWYSVDVFAPSTGKTYSQTVPGPKKVVTTGSPLQIIDSGIKRTVTVTGHNAAGAGPSATAEFTS